MNTLEYVLKSSSKGKPLFVLYMYIYIYTMEFLGMAKPSKAVLRWSKPWVLHQSLRSRTHQVDGFLRLSHGQYSIENHKYHTVYI